MRRGIVTIQCRDRECDCCQIIIVYMTFVGLPPRVLHKTMESEADHIMSKERAERFKHEWAGIDRAAQFRA